jgi:phosphatidylinositol alpha-1,6-mannosyltransferase
VIREGENGHLVPTRDAEAFAATILRHRADRAALAEASRRAAAYTAASFSWTAIAERFVELLG